MSGAYWKLYYIDAHGKVAYYPLHSPEAEQVLADHTEYVAGTGKNLAEMKEDIAFTRRYLKQRGLLNTRGKHKATKEKAA